MILGSDGLEYEDLNARFQRKPALNDHNRLIEKLREGGKDPFYTGVWSRAYRFAEKANIGQAFSFANACASKALADRNYERRRTLSS